jgi:hypothetical protein
MPFTPSQSPVAERFAPGTTLNSGTRDRSMPCASELRADTARARAVEMRVDVNFIADGLVKSYSVKDDKR